MAFGYGLSFIIPNAILIPGIVALLHRVYRGSDYAYIKQIGFLLLISSTAAVGYGVLWKEGE